MTTARRRAAQRLEDASRPTPRGGARVGAGRPVTTGSGATRPVSFRLSTEARLRASTLAEARGLTVDALAREALLELVNRPVDAP